MITLKAWWEWLKRNVWAVVAVVGAAFAALAVLRNKRNAITDVHEALQVSATKKIIAKQESKANELAAKAEARQPEIDLLKREIAISKRRQLEAATKVGSLLGLDDDEVAKRLTEVGL